MDRNGPGAAPAHRQWSGAGRPQRGPQRLYSPAQVHLDETDCVNAQSTQRLYEKRLAARPTGPVHVVCDNARYYKNKVLNAWLVDKRIEQVFLPSYSPNLNLMERLRKFLRQKIINTSFFRTKGQFKTAVLDFFDRLP